MFDRVTMCQKSATKTFNGKVTVLKLGLVSVRRHASLTPGSAESRMAVGHTMMMIHGTL